jgi:hypothetical protein
MELYEIVATQFVNRGQHTLFAACALILPVSGHANNSLSVFNCRHFHGKSLIRRLP